MAITRAACKMSGQASKKPLLFSISTHPFALIAALSCACLSALSQPAQQFEIGPPGVLPNGSFAFGIAGPLGRTYVIDAATNLLSWSSVATNTVSSDAPSFVDTTAPQFQQRFYRGKLYWTVIIPNQFPAWETIAGADGRTIAFPSGWTTGQGQDGRRIAFPPAWGTAQGADGRLIAFPPGWTTSQGPDGRLVSFPPSGFATVQGRDGRIVAFPSSGWTTAGGLDARQIAYLSAGWTTLLGGDGRLIAFPSYSFLTAEGSDARILAFPSAAWTQTQGTDARSVSYPLFGFTGVRGSDGRFVAYPLSGWTSVQGSDGRMVAYPTNQNATIQLDFQDQSSIAVLGTLNAALSNADFSDYVVYGYFGTGEQQFAE